MNTPRPDSAPTDGVPAERWFADEIHSHDGQLKAYLRGAFPSLRDVEDLVQESYLRVWRARLERPIASARGFLFQVARHLAIDLIRRHRAVPHERLRDSAAESVIHEGPSVAEALSHAEKVGVVADALAHLPPRCREVVILRKFQHVSQREIARRLGISERTVESQVTRGMKLCESYLRRHGIRGLSADD
jgi:RNA polymerase sigma factor (sigma-70 family)